MEQTSLQCHPVTPQWFSIQIIVNSNYHKCYGSFSLGNLHFVQLYSTSIFLKEL